LSAQVLREVVSSSIPPMSARHDSRIAVLSLRHMMAFHVDSPTGITSLALLRAAYSHCVRPVQTFQCALFARCTSIRSILAFRSAAGAQVGPKDTHARPLSRAQRRPRITADAPNTPKRRADSFFCQIRGASASLSDTSNTNTNSWGRRYGTVARGRLDDAFDNQRQHCLVRFVPGNLLMLPKQEVQLGSKSPEPSATWSSGPMPRVCSAERRWELLTSLVIRRRTRRITTART
jgi:hypothetical protein